MKSAPPAITTNHRQHGLRRLARATLFLSACSSAAFGQYIVAPSQPNPDEPLRATERTPPPAARASQPPFMQWGSVTARPRLAYRFVSARGIPSGGGQADDTVIQTISPGISFGIGTRWTVDYQPSWSIYSSESFDSAVDHTFGAAGRMEFENWSLRFSQNSSRSFQPLIETGEQTREDRHTTAVNANVGIGGGYSLETSAVQNMRYTTGNDTIEWTLTEWLHFQFSPHLDTAIGVGSGYVQVDPGTDINYFQFSGKIDWLPGTRLSLHLEAGIDRRKIRFGDHDYSNNGITNATMEYQLFGHTVLRAGASRTLTIPYFSNNTQKNFRWSVGLDQRIFGVLNLALSGGQQTWSYDPVGPSSFNKRDDRDRWYDARISTTFFRRGSVSVFYHHAKNVSSEEGFSFSSAQTGVELRYQY